MTSHKRSGVVEKYLKLDRKDISYLQFIIESYEGLATVTTVDKNTAIVRLSIMPDFVSDIDKILNDLGKEIDFTPLTQPSPQGED
ncbi:MAG: DUF4911 domain-containing protein [Proteobacteria bacterium]|nr:DUF4911 domain-containing protein [Pseudomonadota bacterium]